MRAHFKIPVKVFDKEISRLMSDVKGRKFKKFCSIFKIVEDFPEVSPKELKNMRLNFGIKSSHIFIGNDPIYDNDFNRQITYAADIGAYLVDLKPSNYSREVFLKEGEILNYFEEINGDYILVKDNKVKPIDVDDFQKLKEDFVDTLA